MLNNSTEGDRNGFLYLADSNLIEGCVLFFWDHVDNLIQVP